MAIDLIPAMTGAEIRGNIPLPPTIAWLSCHFSPWHRGLSNLPDTLPEGSVLILDDSAPMRDHDFEVVTAQLREAVEKHRCCALLLDFQRPGNNAAVKLAEHLVNALPFPVGVSEFYASGLPCPVFLPPVPTDRPIREYLTPWQTREIWLDISPGGMEITLTADGAIAAPLPAHAVPSGIVHTDEDLHCHYTIELTPGKARFRLHRTWEDLTALSAHAAGLGVTKCVGLWQELKGLYPARQNDVL